MPMVVIDQHCNPVLHSIEIKVMVYFHFNWINFYTAQIIVISLDFNMKKTH